jgi:ABC-2 type transport system permease protein
MNLDSVAAIMRREYVERVRTKSFAVMTILIPAIMLLSFAVPDLVRNRSTPTERRLAIFDATGMLADTLMARLRIESGRSKVYQFDVLDADGGGMQAARQMVKMGTYDALVVIPDDIFDLGRAMYVQAASGRAAERRATAAILGRHVVAFRLVRAGIDPGRAVSMVRGVEIDTLDVVPADGVGKKTAIMGTVAMAMLMYVSLMLYGAWTMQGVLKDKTSGMAEILVSTVSPTDLMAGKVAGIGSVGLTQVGIWMLVLSAATVLAPTSPVGVYAEALGGSSMVAFLLLYAAGFLLFATLYAGAGGMCSSVEDTQHVQWPILILSWVPVFLIGPAVEDPNAGLIVTLSYVPFFAPVLMMMRLGAGAAGWFETSIALCLMAATTAAAAWVGGRVFRTGILMMGKRPTIGEMWRWVREAR